MTNAKENLENLKIALEILETEKDRLATEFSKKYLKIQNDIKEIKDAIVKQEEVME